MFVLSGSGRAQVGRRSVRLRGGDLLLIEKRELHRITNKGRRSLVTLNVYAPPAYTSDGEPG
jgi:mannose-6-phosphate isomerase-like protein (cupin superfamily)